MDEALQQGFAFGVGAGSAGFGDAASKFGELPHGFEDALSAGLEAVLAAAVFAAVTGGCLNRSGPRQHRCRSVKCSGTWHVLSIPKKKAPGAPWPEPTDHGKAPVR